METRELVAVLALLFFFGFSVSQMRACSDSVDKNRLECVKTKSELECRTLFPR